MKLIDFYNTCLSYSYVTKADVYELISFFFNVNKEDLIFNKDKVLEEDKVRKIISKLERKVPISYILGYVYFCGLKIKVNKNVLIPRVETEELLNYIYGNFDLNNKKILDLCTGSGCIALSIKSKFKNADVYASDISEKAIKVAKENSKENNLNVSFIKSDFLNEINDTFDVIISNPPYIPLLEKTETKYEPKLALFSGIDGCDSYRRIFNCIEEKLNPKGIVLLEIEPNNVDKIKEIINVYVKKKNKVEVIKDLEKKDRFIKVIFD